MRSCGWINQGLWITLTNWDSDAARMPCLYVSKDNASFVGTLFSNLEVARRSAKDILQERKEAMVKRALEKSNHPQLKVGDVVYLYTPVIATGNSTKLSRPWVGPYYIVEKLSDIHVKIRRKDNNTIVKNRIHINRLKLGYLRSDQPDDPTPPTDSDSVEPAILGEGEIPPPDHEHPAGEAAKSPSPPATRVPPSAAHQSSTVGSQRQNTAADQKTYEIERILRKSFSNCSWK